MLGGVPDSDLWYDSEFLPCNDFDFVIFDLFTICA